MKPLCGLNYIVGHERDIGSRGSSLAPRPKAKVHKGGFLTRYRSPGQLHILAMQNAQMKNLSAVELSPFIPDHPTRWSFSFGEPQ